MTFKKIFQKLNIISKYKDWRFRKRLLKIKKPIVIGLIFVLLVLSIYFLFLNSNEVRADWWSTDWHYRKAITVTNSGSAQTDFQVKVTVDTSDSDKFQGSCEDVRFTSYSGDNLDYWIESGCGTATTDIWVKIDSIPVGDSIIYMYYGNSSASAGKRTIGTSSFPALSCKAILDAGDSNGDGVYYIDSTNGSVSDKFQAYCDMSDNGGGWMLVTADMVDSVYTAYMTSSTSTGPYGGIRYNFVSTEPGCGSGMSPRATVKISNDYQWDQVRSKKILGPNGKASCWGVDGASYTVQTNLYQYNASEGDVIQDCQFTCEISQFDIPPSVSHCDSDPDNFARYNENENRYFTQTSRRIDRSTISGPGVGLDCQDIGLDWSIENIFIKEDSLLYPNITFVIDTEEIGPGPVGYWSFDNGYGSVAEDRTSNNNDGIITGATWQSEDMCMSGKCLYLDGSDNHVDWDNSQTFDLSGEVTFSFWAKHPNNSNGVIFGDYGVCCSRYIQTHENGNIYFESNDDSNTCYGTMNFDDHNWHHYSLVVDNYTCTFYEDGVDITVDSDLATANVTFDGFGSTGSKDFNGFIDEPKIYPYARTADQVKADYNAGFSGGSASSLSSGGQASPGTASSTNLSDGLVGYWKMDESSWNGTSGEVVDSSGNDNDGTGNGGVTTDAGKYGNGGDFDGTDDYVDVGNKESFKLSDSSGGSIVAWFKINQFEAGWDNGIIHKGDGASWANNHYGLIQYDGQNKLLLNISDGVNYLGLPGPKTGELQEDVWYHVVATWDDSLKCIYINGSLQECVNSSIMPKDSMTGCSVSIGGYGSSYNFNGKIDEARIYNRALSEREVSDLYNWAPGPVGYWKMDKNAGSIAYDSSGNDYNSTSFGGSPEWSLGKYGTSLYFDENGNSGAGEYAYISDFNFTPTTNITVTAWIKPEAAVDLRAPIVRADRFFFQHYSDDRLATYWYGWNNPGYHYSSVDSVPINEWSHVGVTWGQGSGVTFYINGKKDNQIPNSGIGEALDWVRIGQEHSGRRFNGKIDEVRIYNYPRTQKQIIEDMNAGHPAQTNPIAYWKFDEGYGSNTIDSSNNNYDMTINGGVWTDNGKSGKTLELNGSSDYINRDISSDNFDKHSSGTFSFWFNWDDSDTDTSAGLLAIEDTTTEDNLFRMSLGASTGTWDNESIRVEFMDDGNWVYNYAYLNGNTFYRDGEWHHAAFTINDQGNRLYVDGQEVSVDQWGISPEGQSSTRWLDDIPEINNLYLGSTYHGGAPYINLKGKIDEFKIYNYALSEDEIKNEYNLGQTAVMGYKGGDGAGDISQSNLAKYCVPGSNETCSPPIAEWNFEECTGSTAYDTSGNGYTGTLEGNVTWKPGKIGRGLEFDGDGDYINFPQNNFKDATYSLWFNSKIIEDSVQGLFGDENSVISIIGIKDGDTIRTRRLSTVNDFNFSPGFNNDEWYHFSIVTADIGSNVQETVYINGQKVGTLLTDDTAILVNSIGIIGTVWDFNGKIDQVKIYNYARTPAQIAWDYNKGKPVGHWKMDECQGETVIDRSGHGNDGTISLGSSGETSLGTCEDGTGAWGNGKDGKINESLNFDGDDDYIDLPTDQLKSLGTYGNWTISAWAKTSSSGNIFSYGHGSLSEARFSLGSDRIYLYDGSSSLTIDFTGVQDNNWHHLIAIFNRDESAILGYVDGVKFDEIYWNGNIYGSEQDNTIDIGTRYRPGSGYNKFFNGQIDDVRIYNYALTEEQVRSVYNNGSAQLGTGD